MEDETKEDKEQKEPEKTETVDTKTEEPEKPETNEHAVPPVLDKPVIDVVDRVVIVEVVNEDDKKETQIQSDDYIEKEDKKDAAETVSEIKTDDQEETTTADTFSTETDESLDTETETQLESEEESESDSFFDVDVASDVFGISLDIFSEASEPETETEMFLNIDSDINTSYLKSIDLKLTCIIFILLFSVCERKLRYGVRSLCGRIKND